MSLMVMKKRMIETPGTVSIRLLSKKEKRIIKQSFISKILFYVIIFAIFIKNIVYIDFNQIQNADVHNLIKTLCFVEGVPFLVETNAAPSHV